MRNCTLTSGAEARLSGVSWSNAGRACPQFCSFMELKRYIDPLFEPLAQAKLAGEIERIDRFFYDIKYVVDLIDTYDLVRTSTEAVEQATNLIAEVDSDATIDSGVVTTTNLVTAADVNVLTLQLTDDEQYAVGDRLPELVRLVEPAGGFQSALSALVEDARQVAASGAPLETVRAAELEVAIAIESPSTLWKPARLDVCGCEDLLRCPNGTFSGTRAESIESCMTDTAEPEILQRSMPVPRTNQWISDPDELAELTDPESPISGVGKLRLLGMETAVVTFNLTSLAANMTYFEHYRLSAYVDCTPCPPRYGCDTGTTPPTCSASAEQ